LAMQFHAAAARANLTHSHCHARIYGSFAI